MREFRAKVKDEMNGQVYTRQTAFNDVIPGIPLRLHNDGTYDPPGIYWDDPANATVTYDNLHRIYVCVSWKDSMSYYGNEQAAMIPITQPFAASAIIESSDFVNGTDVAAIEPGDQYAFISGKLYPPTETSPAIFQVIRKPEALFNGEYYVEFATWGLRTEPNQPV